MNVLDASGAPRVQPRGFSKVCLAKAGLKQKLKSYQLNTNYSPVTIYLSGLAPSGRKAMAALLQQSVSLLQANATIETYDWGQLTFEKIHFVKSAFVDAGYAVSTVNLVLSALKGVAKAAFNVGVVDSDQLLRINNVQSVRGNVKRTMRRITSQEVQQLLATKVGIPISAKRARDHAIAAIGIGAGLRSFEICALDCSDVDLESGVLTVRAGKGNKRRQIYLANEVVVVISTWLTFRGAIPGPLFSRIHKDGSIGAQRLTQNGLAHALNTMRESLGIPSFTPHDMRRTFITRLLEDNVDINTVRQVAGHASISTTTRYDMRDVQWQQRASQNLRF